VAPPQVCLDTADTAPIYQCPEGHLVCEVRKEKQCPHLLLQDCNAKMVECPQCGHSLMNARNRTAEALAQRLTLLRGDRSGQGRWHEHPRCRVKSVGPNQAIAVTVTSPQKVGKGLFSYVAFRWATRSSFLILKGVGKTPTV
jgi:hypothetical protein